MNTIYCHPSAIEQVRKKLEKDIEEKVMNGIHSPFGLNNIKIVTNENIASARQIGWKRTTTLKDSNFYNMVEDLDNPPSWAIHFGLVEPVYEDIVYYLNEHRYTMMTKSFEVPDWDSNQEGKGYPKFYDTYKPISFSPSAGWVKLSI